MSLNFSVANIKDHTNVTVDPANERNWHPVTNAIISATSLVGLGVSPRATTRSSIRGCALWK